MNGRMNDRLMKVYEIDGLIKKMDASSHMSH